MKKHFNHSALTTMLHVTTLLLTLMLNTIVWAQQWEGPWKDAQGWTVWRSASGDGTTTWVWDNGTGERRIGYDTNGDQRYETWQEEFTIQGLPMLQVYHWDKDQNNVDEATAWAENSVWIDKVWDSNGDGLLDSWCNYSMANCAGFQCALKGSYSLVEKKNQHDMTYQAYLQTQTNGSNFTAQKRAYLQYQRADLILQLCKYLELGGG